MQRAIYFILGLLQKWLLSYMTRSGLLLWCSEAPDTSGLNEAAVQNAEIAKRLADRGDKEFELSRERQAKFDPLYESIIKQALTSSTTSDERSAQQWEQYLRNGVPAENRLADAAMNYDTAGRRDEAGASARAGVERESAAQGLAQSRALGRAGISLSSGRALTLDNARRLDVAKASAGADRSARNQVEATGLSLLDNQVKTGRGLVSGGLQAATMAVNAGQAAGGALGNQQSTYNASLSPGMGLYGGAVGANQSAAGIYGNIAGIQQQANESSMAGLGGLGSLLGTLGSAGSGSVFGSLLLSSRKAKDEVGDVDADAALESVVRTPVKAWKYKGDDEVRIGPMAEDVHESTGLGKSHRLDIATELGTLRAAVQALDKRTSGKGLADAKRVKSGASA